MRKAIDYLRTHPVVAVAVLAGIVGVVVLWPRSPQLPPAATPGAAVSPSPGAPSPGAPPVAQPTPTPAPAASPSPAAIAAPVDAGRADPFAPLVKADTGGPRTGFIPVPPPAPLPPPLFPGQPAPGQPVPPPPSPPPPPKAASTAEVVGIVSDTVAVAIVKVAGQTFIVSPGDMIMDKIKVSTVDALKGLVVLEEDGQRFELKMGGVSGAHVAPASSTNN